ncbi:P-loop containing nucleoside triphosphate hydrolase protein [Boletus coccyginus]|nr:P-loop containing nucleoside triphosphate hydrolase protein [Boletus coccyginus]
MAASNVLFLGETNIGECSIIDLVAGPGEQKRTPRHAGRCDDVCSVALDGKVFILHASPTNGTMSQIQNTLTDLRKNGGVHLLVYCMNALHSTKWIHEIHRVIVSYSTPSPPIPTVAVVAGMSNVAQQDGWWSSNEDAFAEQGSRFDDHAFIQTTTTGAQSRIGDISESRRVLRELILQNCAYALNPETDSDFQRTAPYKQRAMGNSFPSLSAMLAGKPSSRTSTSSSSKAIDIVLLGEIGVGKSSLINLIAREDVAEVSSDTIGCTKTAVKYIFEEKGRTFHLYDTPGLVDPQMGVEPFIDPIDTIEKLIRSLGEGNGPDLLLFCIDNSKPTAALQRNYRLFWKVICGGKVPFALAITKLEEGQDADRWWNRHGATIRKYGIDCSGYVGFGRRKRNSDSNADLEEQLRESLLSFFVTRTDRHKNRISSLRSSVGRIVGSVTSFLRSQVSTPERTLMNQCGLEEQTAQELANRLVSFKEFHNDKVYT